MRYMRYTAYVCMYGRREKGAGISLMGVRFFEIVIPLLRIDLPLREALTVGGSL